MRTQEKIILFIIILLAIIFIPNVVNAAYSDTFTTPSGITAKKVVTGTDGTIEFRFSNITLTTAHSYQWSVSTTSDATNVKASGNFTDFNESNKTATITFSISNSNILSLLKETNNAYISIKDNTTGTYVVESLNVDLTLPAMKAFKVNKSENANVAYTLSTDGNAQVTVATTYGISEVYYKFVKIDNESVISQYNQAIANGTDLSTLTCFASLQDAPSDWTKCIGTDATNNYYTGIPRSSLPTESGIYYMWLKGVNANVKTIYGYSIVARDGTNPKVTSITIKSPNTEIVGAYSAPTTVEIHVNIDKLVSGNTTPTLKIKFGKGATRVLTNGQTMYGGIEGKSYVKYLYQIKKTDVGELKVVDLVGGDLKDERRNMLVLSCPPLEKTIKANGESLGSDKLKAIQEFLNKKENNGFLASMYNEPHEVNLSGIIIASDIFEGGAVAEREYKDAFGEEAPGALYKITTTQLKELLKEKIGEVPDNIQTKMKEELVYSEKYDACYTTSLTVEYFPVECIDGYNVNGIYTIIYKSDSEDKTKIVTLRENGDSYEFISNEYEEYKEDDKGNQGGTQGDTQGKGDDTTMGSKLPQTGEGIVAIISIIVITGIGTIFFLRSRKYKEIK